MYYKIKLIIFIVLLQLILSCTNENEEIQTSTETSNESNVESSFSTKLFENLNDPEYYKHERLQFVWRPKNEKLDSIWTIRLDGTDLRRVLDSTKVLTVEYPHFNGKTARSPNRQYIAYASGDVGKLSRNIIDLKSGEVINLGVDTTGSSFYWSPDNKFLFYDLNFNTYKYNIKEMKSIKLKNRPKMVDITALTDGKTLLGHISKSIAFYDYDGVYIREIEIEHMKKFEGGTNSVTPSGSYLWNKFRDYRLYKIDEKAKLIKKHSMPDFIDGDAVLHKNVKILLIESTFGIQKYNLETDQFINIFDGLKGDIMGNLSIIY